MASEDVGTVRSSRASSAKRARRTEVPRRERVRADFRERSQEENDMVQPFRGWGRSAGSQEVTARRADRTPGRKATLVVRLFRDGQAGGNAWASNPSPWAGVASQHGLPAPAGVAL